MKSGVEREVRREATKLRKYGASLTTSYSQAAIGDARTAGDTQTV
jgi:hypothetical protein